MDGTLYNFEVKDRRDFVKFIILLHKDYLENFDSWENKTLPDFLEALSAYAEDIQGYYDNANQKINADKADWSTFADILKGAKIYE